MLLRTPLLIAPLAVLAGCATAPLVETAVNGALPAGHTYALVETTKYFGRNDLPFAALEACLGRGGMHRMALAAEPGAARALPDTLVQLAFTLRPARVRLVRPGEVIAKSRGGAAAREELVLGITDTASGALLLRGSAARLLRQHDQPGGGTGAGTELADALCGAISLPPAAAAQ